MRSTMKHKIVTAAAAAVVVTAMAGCGGPGSPAPSHADKVACRTVYRVQGIYSEGLQNATPVLGIGWQRGLGETAGVSKPLGRDMSAALPVLYALPQRFPGVPTPAQARAAHAALAASERDCRKLGITAANAEKMAAG